MKRNTIHISILEDRENIALVLKDIINANSEFTCDTIYHTAESAITNIGNHLCDILIVDIKLPGMDGISAIKELSTLYKKIQFCVFTIYEDDEKIFAALEAGAKGYILKNAEPDKLLASLKELYEGGAPMSPYIARRVIEKFTKSTQILNESHISDREHEVLNLLTKGYTYKQIGEQMFLSPGTVKQHLHRIYGKLQVTNKTQAINKLKGE
jgi:DNA-binding NarL/FixJ family response regulator